MDDGEHYPDHDIVLLELEKEFPEPLLPGCLDIDRIAGSVPLSYPGALMVSFEWSALFLNLN